MIGSKLGLFYGGCDAYDERAVFEKLCDLVEDIVQLYERENKSLLPVTSDYDWANTITRTLDFEVNADEIQ